jgi:hypothetical protein
MEPSQWEQVLPYTYFAGLNDRKHAEQVIEQYLHQPNALGSLLSLLHTHEIREVLGASVYRMLCTVSYHRGTIDVKEFDALMTGKASCGGSIQE